MQDRADYPPMFYIWANTLDSQRRTGECGVLERGTKKTILSQLLGSGRMLRSFLLGTLADALSSFPWATEVLCVHSSGGCVCQLTPQSGGHWPWLLWAPMAVCQGRAFSCSLSAEPGTADGWPGPKAQQGPCWIAHVVQSCCTGVERLFSVISLLLTLCSANYEM